MCCPRVRQKNQAIPVIPLQMFHYTIERDLKIDPPCHGKSITYRIATPANCSSWVRGVKPQAGTEGSNPASSSGESVSEVDRSVAGREYPVFRRVWAAGLTIVVGRDVKDLGEIAPTLASISVGPYSSTAAPDPGNRDCLGEAE